MAINENRPDLLESQADLLPASGTTLHPLHEAAMRLADMARAVGGQQPMRADEADLAAAGRGELHVVFGRGHRLVPAFRDAELPEQLLVRDIMTDRPRFITADAPAKDAAREMERWRLGALPVVDADQRVIGILGERDLLRHLMTNYLGDASGGKTPLPAPRAVRDVMSRQVLCVSPEQPLAEVASLMTNKDVDRVPVVREGKLVGFLTRGDIVRKLIGS